MTETAPQTAETPATEAAAPEGAAAHEATTDVAGAPVRASTM